MVNPSSTGLYESSRRLAQALARFATAYDFERLDLEVPEESHPDLDETLRAVDALEEINLTYLTQAKKLSETAHEPSLLNRFKATLEAAQSALVQLQALLNDEGELAYRLRLLQEPTQRLNFYLEVYVAREKRMAVKDLAGAIGTFLAELNKDKNNGKHQVRMEITLDPPEIRLMRDDASRELLAPELFLDEHLATAMREKKYAKVIVQPYALSKITALGHGQIQQKGLRELLGLLSSSDQHFNTWHSSLNFLNQKFNRLPDGTFELVLSLPRDLTRAEVRSEGIIGGNVFRVGGRTNPRDPMKQLQLEEPTLLRTPSKTRPQVQPPLPVNPKDRRIGTDNKYTPQDQEEQRALGIKDKGSEGDRQKTQKRSTRILPLLGGKFDHIKNDIYNMSKSKEKRGDQIPNRVGTIFADPEVQREIRELSGEIRPETAFLLGKEIGAFHPRYSRHVLLAMLRALRVAYGQMEAERIPVYLRTILETFRAKGISLDARPKERGTQILLYDHLPTESEMAALVFSLAMNPNEKIPAEVVIFPEKELSSVARTQLEGYAARLQNTRDIQGNPLKVRFFDSARPSLVAKHLQKISSELTAQMGKEGAEHYGESTKANRQFVRNHIVVTMEKSLAARLETEEPTLLYSLYDGMKHVRYETPRASFHYSALQSAALSLSQKDYEALQDYERLVLERESPFLYHSRYDRIPQDWHAAWLAAEAQILETLARAA